MYAHLPCPYWQGPDWRGTQLQTFRQEQGAGF